MNKFKFYFILLITTLSLFSCSKSNDVAPITPPRDYAVQNLTDNADIEEYLKTNYITVVNHAGFADDQDVTITKIPAGGTQPTIYSYLDSATFPKLLSRPVSLHGITYKLYYLVLREGTGQSPCNVDGVLASYRGDYLQRETATGLTGVSTTKFEEVKFPQQILSLYNTITGWGEIFPQFKTGNNVPYVDSNGHEDGTITHTDFGAGVMFIPSGLAYYNSVSGIIPTYSPLVFSFKLYEIQRLDQDGDGIPSYLEDLNGDGYIYDYRNTVNYPTAPADVIRYADDTDKDGIPNFLDADDDGDNYTTKLEIKNPATGLPFPFADIPTCTSGIKNYLDATCHP